MSDNNKKQAQNPLKKQLQNISSPSPSPKEEAAEKNTPPLASPLPINAPSSSSPFDQHSQKRPRYTQWKPLPSPGLSQQQPAGVLSSPAPTAQVAAPSSSDTASSEQEREAQAQAQAQYRKGKFVSPVWKPNEMLCLARAWRAQYQGGSTVEDTGVSELAVPPTRGKTRGDKDREVAEFLNRHGIIRDAKTAGTKWDNMLGEFRKVYEWERGGEREAVGKSYFRLSPYERKIHRLPASFDEDVFEELSQFMGSRMRTPQHSRLFSGSDETRSGAMVVAKPIPPPLHREEDFLISGPSLSTNSKEFRRIGKVRMIWEESVSLWAEEGEHHRGRLKLQGSNFLNADELIFLDDSMVGSTMESFEDGPNRGFSVDRFVTGQQVKVFGRRKSYSAVAGSIGSNERSQIHYMEQPTMRSISPVLEFQDPSEYYLGCLRCTPPTLPTLFELSWHLQEPPPEELRLPLRRDVYKDLPQGKELFFSTSSELLDCRSITFDLLSPIIRSNHGLSSIASSRDSFIGLWDDCINRVVSKLCPVELVLIRKPTSYSQEIMQDQWPNVTGFVRNFCLWRGEESDQLREGHINPSTSLVEKLLWSYMDLPYILGYYAIGCMVTFCALSRSQDRIIRTDLYTLDLSIPSERLRTLVPCWRIASLLPLLADKCSSFSTNITKQFPFSDYERINSGNGDIIEMTPNHTKKFYPTKRKWAASKEIYDYLDRRIPHAEYILRSSEDEISITFKPRGVKLKPLNCEELVEALKHVTKALVALHDISFMHRDLSWDIVMRRTGREGEWFITGFEEAICAPQLNPHAPYRTYPTRGGPTLQAPEMVRGLHGVKVDVWGLGHLVMTCGLARVPEMLKELGNRCLDGNPEQRPTAADCYHHLLQLQTSMLGGGGY